MKKKPPAKFPYLFGSVVLIVTAIAATAILNRSATKTTTDVRARASVTSLVRMTAIVSTVDEGKGIVTVNGLAFAGSEPERLASLAKQTAGVWTVNVTGVIPLASLTPGSRVELQVNPSSFNIGDRTLTAATITVSQ